MKAADMLQLCEYLTQPEFDRNDSYSIEIVATEDQRLLVLDYHHQLNAFKMDELGFEWYCNGGFVEQLK